MKYRDWLQEWLGYYVKPSVKAKTYEKYARQVRRYLAPRLGGYALEELTPLRLQKFAVSLTDGGLSANTANGIITVLQSSLRAAVNAGKAEREHGKSVVRPKIREKQVECFSKAEQKKLEGHILHGKRRAAEKARHPAQGLPRAAAHVRDARDRSGNGRENAFRDLGPQKLVGHAPTLRALPFGAQGGDDE